MVNLICLATLTKFSNSPYVHAQDRAKEQAATRNRPAREHVGPVLQGCMEELLIAMYIDVVPMAFGSERVHTHPT